MRKERSARVVWPRYTPWQERRSKQQMERLEAWLREHQEPHELRLRELLTRQVESWR